MNFLGRKLLCSLTFVTFTISDELRDKKQERAREEATKFEEFKREGLERSRGRRRRENFEKILYSGTLFTLFDLRPFSYQSKRNGQQCSRVLIILQVVCNFNQSHE